MDPQAEMIWELRDQQLRSQEDMARMMDTVWEMAVAMARMEKRPAEAETPATASEPEQMPPPSPPPMRFQPVPVAPPAITMYDFPALGMPVGVSLPRPAVSEEDTKIGIRTLDALKTRTRNHWTSTVS